MGQRYENIHNLGAGGTRGIDLAMARAMAIEGSDALMNCISKYYAKGVEHMAMAPFHQIETLGR